MNFLGMGPLELMLIVVLALIVFGPAKLPEIMGQIGRAIGDFRRATSELSDEFNRTIQAELNETKQTIEETKSALTEVRSAVDSTMSETRAAVTGMPAPQRIAAPAPAVETNGLGHEETTTNGSASAPAMADTSQWSWETSPARPESEQTEPLPAVSSDLTTATDEAASSEPIQGEAEPEAEAKPTEGASPPKERLARDEPQPPY
jgi:sec-independent protein translocase protein TatB